MSGRLIPEPKPRGVFTYAPDPETDKTTTYACAVPGCGYAVTEETKHRCYRKARDHRLAHRTSLHGTSDGQSTVFDALDEIGDQP